MRKSLALFFVCALFISSNSNVSAQVTITATATGVVYASATGGAIVFGVRNNNADAVSITDYANYTENAVAATYTLWYKATPVTGAPGAITMANGWTQIAGPYNLQASQPTGLTPMFSNINFQIPGNSIYRFALVGADGNSPYYATANSGAGIFTGGGIDIISQDNVVSPGYGGAVTAPANTPRGFLGSITFQPALSCTTPVGGTTVASPSSVCSGNNVSLSVNGGSYATGLTYTWQTSASLAGTYTNVVSSTTNNTYSFVPTTTGYYRCAISCNGGAPAYSTPALVTVNSILAANTYTINNTLPTGGPNFASFTDAFNALGCGTLGKVIFNVSAGQTFTENPLTLEGTGTATDSLIFRKSGVGSNPVIVPAIPGTIASSTTLGANGDAILTINGGDFITFDGINLRTNPSFSSGADAYEYGYYLKKKSVTDACKSVTIKNATITLAKTIYSFGIFVSNNSGIATSIAVTSTGGRSESIKISGNTIVNSYGGIMARGYASSSPYDLYDQGIEIGVDGANNIVDFGGGASTSYGIYTIYQNNLQISQNTITSATAGQTTTVYGILTTTANNANGIVSDNRITVTGSGTTTSIYAISSDMGGTGTNNTVRIFNNNITSCTYPTATSGSMYLLDLGASAFNLDVFGNTLTNNTHTPTTTGTMYCLYQNAAVVNQARIYNNVISNNSKPTGTTGTVYLLYNTTAAATSNNEIYGNTISAFSSTSTSGLVYGIYSLGGLTNKVYRNKIFGITNTASTTGSVYGITMASGANNNVYNNFISDLNTPTTSSATEPVRGINITSSAVNTTNNVSYNTVFLKASSSGANFGTAGIYHTTSTTATTSTLVLTNNIVVNLSSPGGTGYSSILRRSSATLTNFGTASNNNLYYTANGTNQVFFYDGTSNDPSLVTYQARVSPRETSSVTENPAFVNVSTTPYDLHLVAATPTRAESGGTPVSSIDRDIDNDSRNPLLPDIGADEFTGVAIDGVGPAIAYTSEPTNSICLDTKNTTVTIADATGINIAAGTKPRLWYKKASEDNVLPATNTSASNGWKWVEANTNTSPFTFTFDFSRLTSPLTVNDNINYFIVAQDLNSTPNVGVNTALFSTPPTGVALAANVFPISGTLKNFTIQPQPGTLVIKSDKINLCVSGIATLNVDGISIPGAGYQWQRSPRGANTFTDISGATTIPYTTGTLTDSTDFRLVVTCGGSPIASSPSPLVTVNVNNPQITSTTPGFRCGAGTVNLGATASGSAGIFWYQNSTGGSSIASGSPFTTPNLSNSATYYVSAGTGGTTQTSTNGVPNVTTTTQNTGLILEVLTDLVLNSVDVYPTIAGPLTLGLYNSAGTLIKGPQTFTVTAGTIAIPQTLTVDWDIQIGAGYRILVISHPGGLGYSSGSFPAPFGNGVGNTTGGAVGTTSTTTLNYFVYNLRTTIGCNGPRVPVLATVNNDPGCVVPVKLLSFTGEKRGASNKLSWSTATELNNTGFELERSMDGIRFSKMVFVASKAPNGNSNAVISYSSNDVAPLKGTNYYRLKQIDKDGKAEYSHIISLQGEKMDALQIISIYPNPVKDKLNLRIISPTSQNVSLVVTDAIGRIILSQPKQLTVGENAISLPTIRLAQGNYYVKIFCASGCQEAVDSFIKE